MNEVEAAEEGARRDKCGCHLQRYKVDMVKIIDVITDIGGIAVILTIGWSLGEPSLLGAQKSNANHQNSLVVASVVLYVPFAIVQAQRFRKRYSFQIWSRLCFIVGFALFLSLMQTVLIISELEVVERAGGDPKEWSSTEIREQLSPEMYRLWAEERIAWATGARTQYILLSTSLCLLYLRTYTQMKTCRAQH